MPHCLNPAGKVRMERELSKIIRRKPGGESSSSSGDKSADRVSLEKALKGVPVKDLIRLLGKTHHMNAKA